jgi:quercetin dioxygenase-like cupin family protein
MIRNLLLVSAVTFLFLPFAVEAQERPAIVDRGPEHHIILPAGTAEWRAGPGSLAEGAGFTVLEGNPAEAGFFTMRLRLPDGFVIAPHTHPGVERVTVLSGTFHLGTGEALDRASAQPLTAGSYFSLPPGAPHFAIAEGETVIQLSSIGPWQIRYVNPADDPRGRR